MFPMGGPDHSLGPPAVAADLNQISPYQVSACGRANGPLTTALKVGGAKKATPRDFRMLGGSGELQVPTFTKDYEVWALAGRLIQADGAHYWYMDVRLGPNARGESSNEVNLWETRPHPSAEPLFVN